MAQSIADGLTFLTAQSPNSLFWLFWFVIIFEAPRYAFSFVAAAFFLPRRKPRPTDRLLSSPRVSVLIAGHNEAASIEQCVLSLHEQTRPPDEIIAVSDGSTDRMPALLRSLQQRGLIDQAHCTELRAGKSGGMNLAWRQASGDLLVNIDCDCSLDRDALRCLIEPFADAKIGAVCGNIFPRNWRASAISAFQAIEYVISISLGKKAAMMLDQVTCMSGAFSAFRREAFAAVSGLDSGGGEDFDVTLKLRNAGWKVCYAPTALCYTDVPATLTGLIRQRFRWERDAVRLRFRKHKGLINPFARKFRPLEAMHEIEFLLFNVIGAAAFPIYLIWILQTYGEFAPAILIGAQAGLLVLDFSALALAAWAAPQVNCLRLIPYLPGYAVLYGGLMRAIRLFAYVQEWVFKESYRDVYVPMKVQRVRS
ncbi:MAG: glycosyltransferase [Parvularculaceae bacterium]